MGSTPGPRGVISEAYSPVWTPAIHAALLLAGNTLTLSINHLQLLMTWLMTIGHSMNISCCVASNFPGLGFFEVVHISPCAVLVVLGLYLTQI